jgi:pimeloyl-ACP methyl ester carboxylesterase
LWLVFLAHQIDKPPGVTAALPAVRDALPRRGYVGLQLAPLPDASGEMPGLYVRSVAVGSAAARAGAKAGDRLLALGKQPITDMNSARAVLRSLTPGDPLQIRVLRAGAAVDLVDEVRGFPVEQHAHAQVVLEHVQLGAHRLRAIALLPESAGPYPVVYYLPGAHWASEEYPFTPEHPVPALLGQLAQMGIASLRVDRSGMGDSEGPACNDVDFDTEYRGYQAGLELLAQAPWCDATRVALLGHSLGAMVAPLLATDPAARVAARAVVTFGASAIPISAGLVTAVRRYAHLQPEVTAETIERQCELLELIVAGQRTPRQALLERPDLQSVKPSHFTDETIFRRAVRYYHQLEDKPLAAAWRNVSAPVLAIHGSHDFICAPEDSQHVAELAPHGEFATAALTDHQLAHVDAADGPAQMAPAQPRTENQTLSPTLAQLVTGTLKAQLK